MIIIEFGFGGSTLPSNRVAPVNTSDGTSPSAWVDEDSGVVDAIDALEPNNIRIMGKK